MRRLLCTALIGLAVVLPAAGCVRADGDGPVPGSDKAVEMTAESGPTGKLLVALGMYAKERDGAHPKQVGFDRYPCGTKVSCDLPTRAWTDESGTTLLTLEYGGETCSVPPQYQALSTLGTKVQDDVIHSPNRSYMYPVDQWPSGTLFGCSPIPAD